MRSFAVGLVAILVSGSGSAATAEPPAPSGAEILRVLSEHTGKQLTMVADDKSFKDESGAWHVRAFTAAGPSKVSGLCERTRVAATMTEWEKTWKVRQANYATAVASKPGGSAACDKLPAAAFFTLTDTVRPGDLKMVIDAVNQIQPCARQSDECNTRITGTPWRLLERVAARTPLRVLYLDRDPNRSSDNLLWYTAHFTMDDSGQRFSADIRIAEGRVKVIDIGEVVP